MLASKNWLSTNRQSHSEISIVTGKDINVLSDFKSKINTYKNNTHKKYYSKLIHIKRL